MRRGQHAAAPPPVGEKPPRPASRWSGCHAPIASHVLCPALPAAAGEPLGPGTDLEPPPLRARARRRARAGSIQPGWPGPAAIRRGKASPRPPAAACARPQEVPVSIPQCHPPSQVCVAHGVTAGNWAGPRAVTWGLRILKKGRLGLKMPHEPGDYSFVAQIFMHLLLCHLRRWRSGMRIMIFATPVELANAPQHWFTCQVRTGLARPQKPTRPRPSFAVAEPADKALAHRPPPPTSLLLRSTGRNKSRPGPAPGSRLLAPRCGARSSESSPAPPQVGPRRE